MALAPGEEGVGTEAQGLGEAKGQAVADAVRFVVQAEFRGTHQGTVLTLLDMKESE